MVCKIWNAQWEKVMLLTSGGFEARGPFLNTEVKTET